MVIQILYRTISILATFQINIGHLKSRRSLSNMPAQFRRRPIVVLNSTIMGHPVSLLDLDELEKVLDLHHWSDMSIIDTATSALRRTVVSRFGSGLGSLGSMPNNKPAIGGIGSHSNTNKSKPVSNGKRISRKYVWDIYETSLIMSTYNVAMAVLGGNMAKLSFITNGKEVHFWTTTESFASEDTEMIKEYVSKSLDFLEDYTNMKDDTTKMDIVEVVGLGVYAQENWGLITMGFRTLDRWEGKNWERKIASEDYAITVAHEIAHYWFGNMVTCKDWSE